MKQVITIIAWAIIAMPGLMAQGIMKSPTAGPPSQVADLPTRVIPLTHSAETAEIAPVASDASTSKPFEGSLAPFYHGVASGDPLNDRVIIWTRVTPDNMAQYTQSGDSIKVIWRMATDKRMQRNLIEGETYTNASKDFTVKVDVTGLGPNRTYYYEFEALGARSLRGRTKTMPKRRSKDHVRLGVVSCSNYEAGYFNAYGRLAEQNDLDAVIHLGDYIYEYAANVYGDLSLTERRHEDFETVMLGQYRARYSQYRLDPDLRRAHQQHPFINVWDDHEIANDSYVEGAENHDSATQGDWEVRKAMAKKAYFEWIPIRQNPDGTIYRKIPMGPVGDLIMVDTRIEGRDEQIFDVTNPLLYAPDRTMLGETQRNWLFDNLSSSTGIWKVIGNQVIFSQFNIGWFSFFDPTADPLALESIFLDIWDGYPAERLAIINYIEQQNIEDVVILTGDFHSSFAFDVADTVVNELAGYTPVPNYNPETGEGAVAVEFATPSISSANFDENIGQATSDLAELVINNGFAQGGVQLLNNPNPHMKFADLDRHGFYILDLNGCTAQGDYYFVDKLNEPSTGLDYAGGLKTNCGENHLVFAAGPAEKKRDKVAAPIKPRDINEPSGKRLVAEAAPEAAVLNIFPNPAAHKLNAQYALENEAQVSISLVDLQGREIAKADRGVQPAGLYVLQLDVTSIPAGIYLLKMDAGKTVINQRVIIE